MSGPTVSVERLRKQRANDERELAEIRAQRKEARQEFKAAVARGEDGAEIWEELQDLRRKEHRWREEIRLVRQLEAEAEEEGINDQLASLTEDYGSRIAEANVGEEADDMLRAGRAWVKGFRQGVVERVEELRALYQNREFCGKVGHLELEPIPEPGVPDLAEKLSDLAKEIRSLAAEVESGRKRHSRLHVEPILNLSVEPPHPSSRNAFRRAKRLLTSLSPDTLAVAEERLREALRGMWDALDEDEQKLAGPRP